MPGLNAIRGLVARWSARNGEDVHEKTHGNFNNYHQAPDHSDYSKLEI